FDLVEAARAQGGQVIVTIFVNPLQFGAGEDFDAYPRCLEADLAQLEERGVDLVYAPSVQDMYPQGAPQIQLHPGPLGEVFEGAVRPGHFRGVLTVVTKLARRTRAQVAVFGQKDAQQLALVRQLNRDLDLGLKIIAVPTRREADGLALSSRNAYLTAAQRQAALALPQAITAGQQAAREGAGSAQIVQAARHHLAPGRPLEFPDYLELVDPHTFQVVPEPFHGPALLIGAFKVGPTRLIDNAPVTVALGA
ncbi:MAG: pantoate--beta-alanine ligase, partial [Bifidobacteriaceae bacterium]|nr:pantoate--beta-alanine ligase [Bifidobacteriaceae bacterium]